MRVKQLTQADVASRLRGDGLRIRMGPFMIALRTGLPELIEPIRLLYEHYQLIGDDAFLDFDVGVACTSLWGKHVRRKARFYIDGQIEFPPFDRALALPMLEWAINWCVFTRPHQYLILHSAVVEKFGHAVVLPGEPGAGKSTLCAGLCLRGWRLLSDEVAVMRPPSPRLVPVPRPIGLKEESIGVIRNYDPAAVFGPDTPGTKKGTVAHVRPDAESVERGQETAAPGLIVFPSYTPGVGVACKPFGKGRTILRIGGDAFNFSILGETGFETLTRLVDASDCYTLVYSRLDDAAETLDRLLTDRIERGGAERAPAALAAPSLARLTG